MTLSGEEFLLRFLLHVLPDRFVRIRYCGPLANRHREKTLALCREVLPGPPARPKPPKTDWRDRLQSLTGIDPLKCEVCGQKTYAWWVQSRRPGHRGLRRDEPAAHSSIPMFLCSAAEPGSSVT